MRVLYCYWSYLNVTERCRYQCHIVDKHHSVVSDTSLPRPHDSTLKPVPTFEGSIGFVVSVIIDGKVIEEFTDSSCDGVWQQILVRIEQAMKSTHVNRLRIFREHLKGEHFYGLNEPHIVRAIESLPGVDRLPSYNFKFDRLHLIKEMPLAINPTGCSRSEPKLRTHIRRRASADGSYATPMILAQRSSDSGGLYNSPPLRSSISSPLHSKSGYSSLSKSQQYRRLSTDWRINVVLARSRIQGMGLFAARNLSKHSFIIEYLGELIRSEVGNRRERVYESQNRGVYMFRVDDDYIVDATMCGGLARYINHSCEPNCTAEILTCDNSSHIIIIANKDIEHGEELTYDYKFDIEEDRRDRIPCLCGAPTCRKWMN